MHDRLDPTLALPDLAAIRAAHERIRPHVHRTPVFTCAAVDAEVGARLWFKAESLQKIGAFKARGASNAVFSLSDDVARRGVVTHSSGNHGAAIAYAAGRRGIPAWVVMPENSAKVKQENVRRLGATIRYSAPDAASRAAVCAEVERETGATLIHPFDNADVIAGQGTAALELLEDVPSLDVVIAPVGGGGLLSGTSIAAKGVKPGIRVFGAEPANAGDAAVAFRSGKVEPLPPGLATIADGLRTPLAPRTLAAIRANVDDVGTCSEDAIVRAMRMTFERMKLVIEPSAAVPLACLLDRSLSAPGARIGVIVSGGNVDLDRLPWQRGA
ncbi:MAG: pyridoxal-phosphate dependent enzyme [Betaproteobacteria bacterium]|nr:pyridoxal-phosphate dependent enzyme [Betaproteobacteria bacterium]